MVSKMESDLQQIAKNTGVPLVDVRSEVAALGSDGIGGQDSYIDHVHPNIAAHQTMASKLVGQLVKLGTVPDSAPSVARQREVRQQHVERLSKAYFANGGRRIGWLEGWARRQRLFDETQPTDGRTYQAAALRYLELRQLDEAKDMLDGSLDVAPGKAEDLVGAAAGLFQSGRVFEAGWLLDRMEESMSHLQPQIDHAHAVMAGKAVSAANANPAWQKLTAN